MFFFEKGKKNAFAKAFGCLTPLYEKQKKRRNLYPFFK